MGTLTKRGDHWRAQVRKRGESRSASFSTKREAQAWITATEADALRRNGTLRGRPSGTVGALLDRYELDVYPLKRWGIGKAYELAQLRRDLGDESLGALDQARVVAYALGLRRRMSGGCVRSRLSYLAEVCRAANDLWGAAAPLGEVEAAVAGLSRQKVLTRSPPRTRRPGGDEIDRIAAHAGASKRAEVDLAAILAVLRLVPLRVGELVAIQWDDLRPAERAVVIRNRKHPDSAVREGNDYVVPLPVLDGVDTYPLVADRPRYLARPFPWSRATVSSSFWLTAAQCSIADLHLHDLRALAISRLLEDGVPIPLVAHMSGHKNWRVLQKHYARIDPAAIHAAIARTTA